MGFGVLDANVLEAAGPLGLPDDCRPDGVRAVGIGANHERDAVLVHL